MKKLFLLVAASVPACLYAQHLDFAYNAGLLAAKTSSYSSGIKPDDKIGAGFTNSLTAKYISRIGVYAGISLGFSKLTDGTQIMVTTLEHPEGADATKKNVVYGNPSVSLDVIGGYQFRIKKSAISADVKLGYVSNSVKNQLNLNDNVYWPETRGMRFGGDLEYRYYFTRHLSAGVMLSPMVYNLHATDQPKNHFVIDAVATTAGIHYTL